MTVLKLLEQSCPIGFNKIGKSFFFFFISFHQIMAVKNGSGTETKHDSLHSSRKKKKSRRKQYHGGSKEVCSWREERTLAQRYDRKLESNEIG